MEKLHQIFLSSTFSDLIDARAKVIDGLLKAGFYPKCMEYFPASGSTQEEYISKAIDTSGIVVLLLNNRYGEIIDRLGGISYTHFEYKYAIKERKEVLCFINTGVEHDDREDDVQKQKFVVLADEIKRDKLCQIFDFDNNDFSALQDKVKNSVIQAIEKSKTYWVNSSKSCLLRDSYEVESIVEQTGDSAGLVEITMQRIMSVLATRASFSFVCFKEQLELRSNLGRQNSLKQHDILQLLRELVLNDYVKFYPTENGQDIVFISTGKDYQKSENHFVPEPNFF
jgi:hypothetical protein